MLPHPHHVHPKTLHLSLHFNPTYVPKYPIFPLSSPSIILIRLSGTWDRQKAFWQESKNGRGWVGGGLALPALYVSSGKFLSLPLLEPQAEKFCDMHLLPVWKRNNLYYI